MCALTVEVQALEQELLVMEEAVEEGLAQLAQMLHLQQVVLVADLWVLLLTRQTREAVVRVVEQRQQQQLLEACQILVEPEVEHLLPLVELMVVLEGAVYEVEPEVEVEERVQ
jgi:hypothetical protein